MSETFTMRVPSPGQWDRFAPGALDSTIGRPIRIRRDGAFVQGTVTKADITEDGDAVLVTVEVPDGELPWPVLPPGVAYSVTDFRDVQF